MTSINRVRTVRDIWTIRQEFSRFVGWSGVEGIVPAFIDLSGRRDLCSSGRFWRCGLRPGEVHKCDKETAQDDILHEIRGAIRRNSVLPAQADQIEGINMRAAAHFASLAVAIFNLSRRVTLCRTVEKIC
jgi:hypothetical protein